MYTMVKTCMSVLKTAVQVGRDTSGGFKLTGFGTSSHNNTDPSGVNLSLPTKGREN